MLAACETGEVFALLEARDTLEQFSVLYNNVREPWVTRALLMYHSRTGSARALDLLARAPDTHAKYLLDALLDELRGERREARAHALAALASLVARRPGWLHRVPQHTLARDLLRVFQREREPLLLLHALLALAALLPAEPAFASPHWSELAEALLVPASLDPPPPPPARDHLQLAQLALFHALYATHPCTLLETLRTECAAGTSRDAWERGLAPLLRSVRLNPALVTGTRQREAEAARRHRLEIHDVLAESRRLSAVARDRLDERTAPLAAGVRPAPLAPPSPAPGSGAHAARAASALRPGADSWFALSDRCGADSAPDTPAPADADIAEPPEAAVEATPENTPAKETRTQFRYPTDSTAVRAIGRRSQPPSPLRKETSPPAIGASGAGEAFAGRLARVALERRSAESPVPFGGGPPPAGAVARPEPNRATPATDTEPLNVEDREVYELTERARFEKPWASAEPVSPWVRDPRAGVEVRGRAAVRAAPVRRSVSCSPRGRSSVAVQTLDVWPAPYEFLIADFFRHLPDEERTQSIGEKIDSDGPVLPCERLDKYLADLYSGRTKADGVDIPEQLELIHAQLMYERWRREIHAERNRRLLGRCRDARRLELQNAALSERLRATRLERDQLLARLARPASVAPAGASELKSNLEAELDRERTERIRAEAALYESEARRAADAAELRRSRGESFEAARHVEALARAALAAERRAEHVRRLRCELIALAERETRLSAATRAAAGAGLAGAEADRAASEERALRAALARAEAEAESATARAEAATARAHELETTLSARDAAVAELKRAARLAAEEHAARLRALEDKCAALARVVRAGEERRLAWLAGGESVSGANATRARGGAVARGGRPALSECNRVRRLLEREEDDERS